MAIAYSELTESLAYGIDLKNRRLYFGIPLDSTEENPGGFSQASVELAIRSMHKMALDAPGKAIEIHMNSYGGDMYSMLRLIDEILSCSCQIKFFGGGAIMSAASWVMVVCDERYLYPNATVMVHELSSDIEGKHSEIKIDANENTRLMNISYDIYAKNSRMPREFWEDICQRDVYMSAGEAVLLGMADKIVEPKKRGNLRKMRQANLKKQVGYGEINALVGELYRRTNRVKVPKIELNPIVKEPTDPSIVVDTASPTASEVKLDETLLVK